MSRDIPAGGNVPAGTSPSAQSSAPKSKEEFAARLRELRIQAGTPSFRRLAKMTNYSSSTLADATSGRRLPTDPVVNALVTACGADPAPWLENLRRIAATERTVRLTGTPDVGEPDTIGSGITRAFADKPRWWSVRWVPYALAAGALVVFGGGLTVGRMALPTAAADQSAHSPATQALPGVPPFYGTPGPAPTARAWDGTDPGIGHCKADKRLVDRAPVIQDGVQIGALDLLYSSWCGAGWAMIYLYPGQPTMMGEATVRSGDDRFSTMTDPLVKQVDVYTDVIVPGPGGCLGAGGAVYDAGKPVATATIPCQAPTGG